MSTAYRKRKKAIRDEKKRRGPGGLLYGHIPPKDFGYMQANWSRDNGPKPIGTLDQLWTQPLAGGGNIVERQVVL